MSDSISFISKAQFIFEQGFQFLFKDQKDEKFLIESLLILETAKTSFKLKKFFESKGLKYITETTNSHLTSTDSEKSENQEEKVENVQFLRKLLTQLQNETKEKTIYNSEYSETLLRTQKKMRILNSLPIPPDMLQRTNIKSIEIFLGEIIYIIRPLIYCLMLRIFGTKSYKAYLLSLLLDILRIFLQQNVRFYTKSEKSEYIFRIKELLLCYILRNPFYSNILKTRLLLPFLNLVLGKRFEFLKSIIIYFVEVRSCYSLLM